MEKSWRRLQSQPMNTTQWIKPPPQHSAYQINNILKERKTVKVQMDEGQNTASQPNFKKGDKILNAIQTTSATKKSDVNRYLIS